ncbi:MAG: NDP-sugar synthase [Candidatus Peribacteraceae bacterium]|nr:NDP-sugar synthase [Candidatus Peribacteraceae bacterium]
MQAFILAGGFATRLWPLTERRAKPLLPLAGKPLLAHLIEKIPAGMPITISTNRVFAESFLAWQKETGRDDITILIEQTTHDDEKIGALGAVSQWIERKTIEEDVFLLTGDNYCGFSFDSFLEQYAPGTPLLAVHDIGEKERAKAFGTILPAPDGRTVAAFEEKPPLPKSTLVSTGCSVLPSSLLSTLCLFAHKRPDNIGGLFEEFLRRSITIEFFAFSEPWFDIGSFEAYLEAHRSIVGENLLLTGNAVCTSSKTEGAVALGRDTVVRASTLKDVIIFQGCLVEDCVLEDCIIDANCVLKGIDLTGKMLREGTVLTRK